MPGIVQRIQQGPRTGIRWGVNALDLFPSGDAFKAATGITLTSLYLGNVASGNLTDRVGSNHLTAAGTPTYRRALRGHLGVYYDASGDRHAADVLATGANSFIAGGLLTFVTNPGTDAMFLMGRRSAAGGAGAGGWQIQSAMLTNGSVLGSIRDGVDAVNIAVAGLDLRNYLGVPLLFQIQRDNSTTTTRVRVSIPGASAATGSASSAAIGNVDVATMTHSVGGNAAQAGDEVWCGYHYVATGAQCEGSTKLQDIARALRIE